MASWKGKPHTQGDPRALIKMNGTVNTSQTYCFRQPADTSTWHCIGYALKVNSTKGWTPEAYLMKVEILGHHSGSNRVNSMANFVTTESH